MKMRKVIVTLEIETACPLSDLRDRGKWDDAYADTFAVSGDLHHCVKWIKVTKLEDGGSDPVTRYTV